MWWMLALAWAQTTSNDVVVKTQVQASAAEVHEAINDLVSLSELFPADCATWTHSARTQGVGARSKVVYHFGPLRRKLVAVVVADEPGVQWRVEHLTNKGFFTQFTYQETEGVTEVTMTTPLAESPKGFRKIFANQVKPEWERCYQAALDGIAP